MLKKEIETKKVTLVCIQGGKKETPLVSARLPKGSDLQLAYIRLLKKHREMRKKEIPLLRIK